jgi:hypothetical protein
MHQWEFKMSGYQNHAPAIRNTNKTCLSWNKSINAIFAKANAFSQHIHH